jgi:hypothetical protein
MYQVGIPAQNPNFNQPGGFAPPPLSQNQFQPVPIPHNFENSSPPILIESLPEFNLGPREGMRIEITQPGDPNRGILDYGNVHTTTGCTFTGFIASARN